MLAEVEGREDGGLPCMISHGGVCTKVDFAECPPRKHPTNQACKHSTRTGRVSSLERVEIPKRNLKKPLMIMKINHS